MTYSRRASERPHGLRPGLTRLCRRGAWRMCRLLQQRLPVAAPAGRSEGMPALSGCVCMRGRCTGHAGTQVPGLECSLAVTVAPLAGPCEAAVVTFDTSVSCPWQLCAWRVCCAGT